MGETDLDAEEPTTVMTSHGELQVIPVPAGTRLRRPTTSGDREPIGHGLRPAVASKGDLARMLSALGREENAEKLRQLRRLIELEHELGLGSTSSSVGAFFDNMTGETQMHFCEKCSKPRPTAHLKPANGTIRGGAPESFRSPPTRRCRSSSIQGMHLRLAGYCGA